MSDRVGVRRHKPSGKALGRLRFGQREVAREIREHLRPKIGLEDVAVHDFPGGPVVRHGQKEAVSAEVPLPGLQSDVLRDDHV